MIAFRAMTFRVKARSRQRRCDQHAAGETEDRHPATVRSAGLEAPRLCTRSAVRQILREGGQGLTRQVVKQTPLLGAVSKRASRQHRQGVGGVGGRRPEIRDRVRQPREGDLGQECGLCRSPVEAPAFQRQLPFARPPEAGRQLLDLAVAQKRQLGLRLRSEVRSPGASQPLVYARRAARGPADGTIARDRRSLAVRQAT
ncbi:hypothetical protein [Tistlia consotensis]|uniref:hypothetical protein n=1 Tax=Tistlia consotensis TaxID=1321365 RepID=UPI0011803898|nr:hypothetical protein [Tistlia consotensis]